MASILLFTDMTTIQIIYATIVVWSGLYIKYINYITEFTVIINFVFNHLMTFKIPNETHKSDASG